MVFEKSQALLLLDLCEQSYNLSGGRSVIIPAGFSPPTPIYLREPRPSILNHDPMTLWGFATRNGVQRYVVFRGTQTTPEWIEDAIALPWVPFGNGHVHHDFHEGWESLRGATMDAAGVWTEDTIITGHSLGAALATLCRSEFGGNLLTFAGPRVGDAGFSEVLADTVRIVNKPDIVPHLPSEVFGFRHGGCEILVDGPGSITDLHLAHSLESYRAGINAKP